MQPITNQATFRLLWRQLSSYYKSRDNQFEYSYATSQVATLDHKMGWLMRSFHQSPILEIALEENWFALKPKKPESVFCHVVASLSTSESEQRFKALADKLDLAAQPASNIEQAVVDALVLTGHVSTPESMTNIQAWVASLNNTNLSSRLLLLQTEIDESSRLEHFARLAPKDPLALLSQWVLRTPSKETWQQLEALELDNSHVAYSVYAIWGGEQSLSRIVEGLKRPHTNETAHRAWQFLTDTTLPQIPALKDTSNNQAVGQQTFACAQTAEAWCEQLRSQLTLGKARLHQKLTARVSTIDDAIWLYLQAQDSQVRPLLGRRLMRDRARIIEAYDAN